MTDDQIIGLITGLSALILAGSAIVRRRLAGRSMLALVGVWAAIILAGVALARLWLAHRA